MLSALNNITPIPQAAADCTRLSVELLFIEMEQRGYSVRQNVIENSIEIEGQTLIGGRSMSMDDLVTVLHSELACKYKGVSLDTVQAYVSFLAREHQYNPVIDLLKDVKWDNVDRFPEVFSLLGIEDDTLSQVLVCKWLMQSIALLFNDLSDPFGAEGVLVFNGAQGAGKTSFFKRLALKPSWFREGATIKDNDKDTTRRIVTRWISELGEVESTLKSDISALKAFVTSDTDAYRLPYGRSDHVAPRRTSLCATCNSDRYLIDQTGNRRWWTVPIERRIPYEDIQKFDALQLWAQIYALVAPLEYDQKKSCFRLTPAQLQELAARNGEVEKFVKGEAECRDLIDTARDTPAAVWEYQTCTQWKLKNLDALRGFSTEQISTALKHIGIPLERKRLDGKAFASKVYMLPSFTDETK